MNNVNESLLNTINSIDEVIMESEMDVICAKMHECSKIRLLVEYGFEGQVNNYGIIQESTIKSDNFLLMKSIVLILKKINSVSIRETIIPEKYKTHFKETLIHEINESNNKHFIKYMKNFHDTDRVNMYHYLDGYSVKIPIIKRNFIEHIWTIGNLISTSSSYSLIEKELISILFHKDNLMFDYLEYKPIYDVKTDTDMSDLIKSIQDMNLDPSNKFTSAEIHKLINHINKDIIPMVTILTNISKEYISCYYNAIDKIHIKNKG